jgi:hypothetical protein
MRSSSNRRRGFDRPSRVVLTAMVGIASLGAHADDVARIPTPRALEPHPKELMLRNHV